MINKHSQTDASTTIGATTVYTSTIGATTSRIVSETWKSKMDY